MELFRLAAAAAVGALTIHAVWVVRPLSQLETNQARAREANPAHRLQKRRALEAEISAWQAEERLRLADEALLSRRLRQTLAEADLERARARWLAAEADIQTAAPIREQGNVTQLLDEQDPTE